jgi:ABC-type uncharacterized transport system involved in gliding motility auxiliary subunit
MKTSTKFLSALILLVGIVLINFIAGRLKNAQLDTTKEKIYTLSQGTKDLLKSVEGDIEVDFYFSRSREEVPVSVKNQADRVLNLLKQFDNNYKGGDMTLTIIDPKPDTDEEEEAEKSEFGIKGRLGNTLFYTGIKVVYEGEEENINFLNESEEFLEHEVITTIYGLANDSKPVVGLINTLDRMEEHQQFFKKLKSFYEVVNVGATANNLPDDKELDALLVLHPKNITDQLQYAIDQYLLGGGKLFVCVDPSSWIDQYMNGNLPQNLPIGGFQMPNRIDANSDLDKLFEAWGVEYDKTKIVADLSSQIPLPKLGNYPAWIRLEGKEEIKSNDLTENIKLLTFMEPGTFKLKEGSDLSLTPLIQTSTSAGIINHSELPRTQSLYPQYPFDPFQINPRTLMNLKSQTSALNASIEKGDKSTRQTIAGILKGKFKTAFPDGKPANDSATTDKDDDDEDDKELLKEGEGEVILFADIDFLNGMFTRYQSNDNMRAVFAENDILAINLVDYLVTGDKKLSKVKIKGAPFRPFEKIEALEAKRQEKLNEKNKEIDEQIADAHKELENEVSKLNETMRDKQRNAQMELNKKMNVILEPYKEFIGADGTLKLDRQKDAATIQKIVNAQNEARSQIQEDTRAAIMEMQKQIQVKQEAADEKIKALEKQKRKDRKEGREEIESLELRVQLANMLIMPIFVIGAGIAFFSKRRNRR